MNVYIPQIGDSLTLTSDWEFGLLPLVSNEAFGKLLGYSLTDDIGNDQWIAIKGSKKKFKTIAATIPKGKTVKIESYSMKRKDSPNGDSLITFSVKDIGEISHTYTHTFKSFIDDNPTTRTVKNFRFTVRIEDANEIEFKK